MDETLYKLVFVSFYLLLLIGISSLIILLIGVLRWKLKKRAFPTRWMRTVIVLFGVTGVLFYNLQFNLNFLPAGEQNASFPSPNGKYEVHTYHFTGMYGKNAKAVLVNTETSEKNTLYFNWYDYDPQVEWLDNDKVKIGREKLSIHQDTYDYRRDPDAFRTLPPQREMHGE